MTESAYRPRELAALVGDALATMPVVVLTGLRQTGKTTFLRQEPGLAERVYRTLDDFPVLEAARRDPEALLEGDEPVTIDEIQKSPELLAAVKRVVDRGRAPGRFVLSGSANLALLRGVAESLAGRALYLSLHPFTRRERLGRVGSPPWIARFLAPEDDGEASPTEAPENGARRPIGAAEVLDGGMPPIVVDQARRDLWLLGYEQTYLERDVRELSQVADHVSFRRLLQLAAMRTGSILNTSDLARDAKLSASTAARYLDLLETSFVVARLAPFLRSRSTRLIKAPKLYLADSGLAAHLAGVRAMGATDDEPLRGALYETWVHQNLAGLLSARWPEAELAFWNVQGRHEVDFVVTRGRRSVAIEVKVGSRFRGSDLTGLRAFLERTPQASAAILAYNGEEAAKLDERLYLVPLAWLLS